MSDGEDHEIEDLKNEAVVKTPTFTNLYRVRAFKGSISIEFLIEYNGLGGLVTLQQKARIYCEQNMLRFGTVEPAVIVLE